MTRGRVLAVSVLLVGLVQGGLAAPAPAKRGKPLTTLGKKLLGAWQGGGCDGRLEFRRDGTYAWTGYGPGGSSMNGIWKVGGDALPATLSLTCKTAEVPELVGKTTEVKLTTLDDKSLAIKYSDEKGSPPGRYTRTGK
jgi:hypothetical protein